MARGPKQYLALTVVGAIVVVALLWLLWKSAHNAHTATATTATAGTASALIGLAAAGASWFAALNSRRAADRSDETASRAIEALGLAMMPTLAGEIELPANYELADPTEAAGWSGAEVTIWNPSRWAATNVDLIWRPDFGAEEVVHIDRFEPTIMNGDRPWSGHQGHRFAAPQRPAQLRTPPRPGQIDWANRAFIRYSDERGLLRWECQIETTHFVMTHEDGSQGFGHGWRPLRITRID